MKPLDLKEFEWKTVLRNLVPDDYQALVAMQQRLSIPTAARSPC
jgi:hypothetical protein